MIKKEPYDSPKFNVLNLGLENDVVTTSKDVYEDDIFDDI